MANTYTRLYVHVIFAVQGRQCLIPAHHREEINKYITGIVQSRGHKMLAIDSVGDHVHMFIGLNPSCALSDLVRDVKSGSSGFINERRWFMGRFSWQEGYGAFSYAHSDLGTIINYIRNQQEHHHRTRFRDEYLRLLRDFEMEYDERYLFRWIDVDDTGRP